jgi:Kef-type K+ transport system membrane component KefB
VPVRATCRLTLGETGPLPEDTRLLDAALARFPLEGDWKVEWSTDIPRSSGLSGSTALLAATLACILVARDEIYRLADPVAMGELVRDVERNEANIMCGYQDAQMIVHGGLQWMSFAGKHPVNPGPHPTLTSLDSELPFLLITALAGAARWGRGLGTDHVMLTRDAVSIGLAGALSAPTLSKLARSSSPRAIELVQTMSLLDDVLVIVAFACLAAWLRPVSHSGWILPGVGWVFVTFGMAAVLGLLTDAVLRGTESRAERSSLLLGVVALTAGMAAMFQIPPLVVCFLAGVLFRNLPGGTDKREIEDAFARLERPIYHLFLIIVGALWRPELATGWLVLPLFLVARTLGRLGGARLARALPPEARPESLAETPDGDLVLPPMGQLAIAFVITAQTLYESTAVRAMVTAVIGGSIVMELVVQVGARRRSSLVPSTRTHRGSDAGDAT